MQLISFIIPFKDEKEYAAKTIAHLADYMNHKKDISYEMIAVDDSVDGTWEILQQLKKKYKNLKPIKGTPPSGYGKAIRQGFSAAKGDILIPFNGDLCDSPEDAMKYVDVINSGYDMAFGSRYMKDSEFINYPKNRILLSKTLNFAIMLFFHVKCSDISNTFKAYTRKAYKIIDPKTDSYEIGIEMALKGIKKGLTYKTIPIRWIGREYGVSKMRILLSTYHHFMMAMKVFFGKA